jgi:hypothetical protein
MILRLEVHREAPCAKTNLLLCKRSQREGGGSHFTAASRGRRRAYAQRVVRAGDEDDLAAQTRIDHDSTTRCFRKACAHSTAAAMAPDRYTSAAIAQPTTILETRVSRRTVICLPRCSRMDWPPSGG